MIAEERPSGSLTLFDSDDGAERAKFSRADLRLLADVFDLLATWARDAEGDIDVDDAT